MTELQSLARVTVPDRESRYRTCTLVRTYHASDGTIMEQRGTCRTLARAISLMHAWNALPGTIVVNLEVRA